MVWSHGILRLVGVMVVMWLCGYAVMRLCGYAVMWLCGYVVMWLCGYVVMQKYTSKFILQITL